MPAVGDPILAEDMLFARLTADVTLTTSSTTLQDVTGLSVSVAANSTYVVECVLYADNPAGTTEDIQYGFSFPSGASMRIGWSGGTAAGVTAGNASDMFLIGASNVTSSSTFAFGCSTTPTMAQARGLLVTSSSAGTFQIRASQATSGTNASRVRLFSHILLTRVG